MELLWHERGAMHSGSMARIDGEVRVPSPKCSHTVCCTDVWWDRSWICAFCRGRKLSDGEDFIGVFRQRCDTHPMLDWRQYDCQFIVEWMRYPPDPRQTLSCACTSVWMTKSPNYIFMTKDRGCPQPSQSVFIKLYPDTQNETVWEAVCD